MGAVNPLAHLDAEWLGVDPGKTNMATLNALLHVSSKPSSQASYQRFADTVVATNDAMWAEVSKPRWANAKFRLYCGKKVVAGFWSKGCVSQMLKEAVRQLPAGRVVMVDEFRTSRISSAYSNLSEALPG
ncbi:hypothetical protein QJQ45_000029 [Haematococcus lacustris]|nr:hypothetical protein QJQ45_000029 [Haematococcus lacustris]